MCVCVCAPVRVHAFLILDSGQFVARRVILTSRLSSFFLSNQQLSKIKTACQDGKVLGK